MLVLPAAIAMPLVVGDHPVVVATWALILFPLAWFTGMGALVYNRTRQRRKHCPECGEQTRSETVRCGSCGHHFAARMWH